MPTIRIDYDDNKLSLEEATQLSVASQEVVSRVTGIEDVFVYCNTAKIKIKVAPIEIFVEMSDFKVKDLDELTSKIKQELKTWKENSGFKQSINLTVIPM